MTKGGKGNGPLTPQRSRRRHSLLLTVILGLDPRIHRPGTPSLPDKTPSHFPRPLNPCLQSPHPVTDTLPGVAVRRGRRFWFGTDVSPCQKGLRKMVSLRRHGGSGGVSDQPCRFTPRTARRACLCGTQGGWVWRMRRHRPPGCGLSGRGAWRPSVCDNLEGEGVAGAKREEAHRGNRRPTSTGPGLCRGTGVAGKNR